jgi:large subunit ribosomal protein L25
MKKDITIAAQSRETRGKNEARRLRVRGLTPAVVYGAGTDPIAVAVDPKGIMNILRSGSGHNTIFTVDIQGQLAPVMVVDSQHDPIRGRLLHVDLKRIDLTKRISVRIPVLTAGEPVGVKTYGGLHEVITREIEIECLPDEIPEVFNVDVSGLMIGQSIRASDIPVTGSMKLISSPDTVISHVISVKAEEVAEDATAAPAGAEPEVVKKGKKEDEAAAEPEKGKKK